MEWNLQPNAKFMMDSTDEFYEKRSDTQKIFTQEFKEIKVALEEASTEILTKLAKFFSPNEMDVQPTAEQFILQSEHGDLQLFADYYITQEKSEDQQGREEDNSENIDYNWILLDGKFVYGEQEGWFQEGELCPAGQQEEDLIDKRETLYHLMKQLDYKWIRFDEQFTYGKQEDLIQERTTQFKKQFIYGVEEIKKRDLLFGRVAFLWRCIWLNTGFL